MKKYLCVLLILTAVLLAVFAGISGCGIIGGSGESESPTFASKNNSAGNDILADAGMSDKKDTTVSPVTVSPAENPANHTDTNTDATESVMHGGPPPLNSGAPQIPGNDGTTRLSFVAAGDNIMHLNMIHDAQERAGNGERFNFREIYKYIEDMIKSYDIALVNVETPIAGDEFPYSGYPMFNTPKENAFALMDIGFDIVVTANNHMLDKGEKGYKNSIEFWEKQDVFETGSFRDQQDFETIRIYEKDGVTIAFLSYTYSTNGMVLSAGSSMVIPFIDHATIERQVKAARPLADLLFVVMHWGDEDNFTPNQEQRTLAQMMVDNNVDVIIGMHPHVLQETKWVDRPDGKRTLLTYSLGNMVSGMLRAKNMVGAFLSFDIVKTAQNGVSDTAIERVEMIPIISHYTSNGSENFRGYYIYRFEDYTEELANAHGNRVYSGCDRNLSYKFLRDTITQNIAPEFLSDFYKN